MGQQITNLIAYSLSNISAKSYQNRLMCVEVIVCNISAVFLRHSVHTSAVTARKTTRHLRSSSMLLLHKSTIRTHFADRVLRCAGPSVCRNSLNSYTVDSGPLAVFKSSLKTFLFRQTFTRVRAHDYYCPPAPSTHYAL